MCILADADVRFANRNLYSKYTSKYNEKYILEFLKKKKNHKKA